MFEATEKEVFAKLTKKEYNNLKKYISWVHCQSETNWGIVAVFYYQKLLGIQRWGRYIPLR